MSREVALLVSARSRAPFEFRSVLREFALFADVRTRETWVSPDRVAKGLGLPKPRVQEAIRGLASIGELVDTGRRAGTTGRSVVRVVLPQIGEIVRPSNANPRTQGEAEGEAPVERTQALSGVRRVPVARPSADAKDAWRRLRGALQAELTDYAFHIWISPLGVRRLEDGVLTVWAPRHIEVWVRERYAALFRELAERVGLESAVIEGETQREQRMLERLRQEAWQ